MFNKISTNLLVIFITIRSSPFSVFPSGICAWMNALGTLLLITSLFSLASTTDVRNTPSLDAVGLELSSHVSHSRVDFPL